MPVEFFSYASMLSHLRRLLAEREFRTVGIEGHMAAGKTHLSKQLAHDLKGDHIENDNFTFAMLDPDFLRDRSKNESYVQCINLDRLATKFTTALAESALVIVEGICLRDVLTRIDRQADIFVYVKSVSRISRIWRRAIDLEDYKTGREKFRDLPFDELEYHSRVRPQDKADLLLTVMDEPTAEPPS